MQVALVIPPGYGLATWHFKHTAAVRPWVVTCGVDLSDAAGNFTAAATQLSAAITQATTIIDSLDTSQVYTHFTLKVGADGGTGPLIEVTRGDVGADAKDTPPMNLAILVRKTTAFGGRRGRGRMYWAGLLAEAGVDELGIITSSVVTSLQTRFTNVYNHMVNGIGGSPISSPPVILHDSTGAGTEPAPYPVTSFAVQALCGTQRRRMRR